jgi:predicted transposase/invertase (TIGR01784 family)
MEKGLAKGIAKGLAKGIAKGIAENKLEIARKMKEMGDSVERIHTITGLPPETIQNL